MHGTPVRVAPADLLDHVLDVIALHGELFASRFDGFFRLQSGAQIRVGRGFENDGQLTLISKSEILV